MQGIEQIPVGKPNVANDPMANVVPIERQEHDPREQQALIDALKALGVDLQGLREQMQMQRQLTPMPMQRNING